MAVDTTDLLVAHRKRLGSNVRRLRRELQMTQVGLAHDAGMTQGHITRIERGECGSSDEVLLKMAGALGCTLSDLIDDSDGTGDDR